MLTHLGQHRIVLLDELECGAEAHRRTDLDVRVGDARRVEFANAADMDDGAEIAMLLGHPQTDIGGAGDQARARILGVKRCETRLIVVGA